MSETIILIMTSSSTRNTEPRGGRVAFMTSVLAHPSQSTFAKISTGCNFYLGLGAAPGCDCTANKPHWNGISMQVPRAGTGVGTKMFLQPSVDNASNGRDKRFAACLRRI